MKLKPLLMEILIESTDKLDFNNLLAYTVIVQ